jgi:hypothetical protein
MKITIKPKQKKENHDVPFNEIPVGSVYVAKYYEGPIALKLKGDMAVLLTHGVVDASDLFVLADGFKDEPAYEILGKLTEIIVEGRE